MTIGGELSHIGLTNTLKKLLIIEKAGDRDPLIAQAAEACREWWNLAICLTVTSTYDKSPYSIFSPAFVFVFSLRHCFSSCTHTGEFVPAPPLAPSRKYGISYYYALLINTFAPFTPLPSTACPRGLLLFHPLATRTRAYSLICEDDLRRHQLSG